MTVVISRGYRWIAERDGIAHATPDRGRRHVRSLCGAPAGDERLARPAAIKCPECTEVADGRRPT